MVIILRKFKPFESKPMPRLVPGTAFCCVQCSNRIFVLKVLEVVFLKEHASLCPVMLAQGSC